jgi:hypothetical protein
MPALKLAARCTRPVLLTMCAALLAACAHTHMVGGDRTFEVGLTEYRVIPQDVRARAGVLTIIVHNYGRLTHNLVVSFRGHEIDATTPIAPGDTTDLAVTLSPGKYLLASTVLSDQSLGEYGTLTVTD